MKHLNPASFAVGANLSLSPIATSSDDHLELPSTLPAWKMHTDNSSVTIYRILTKGIPEGYPTIYITHVVSTLCIRVRFIGIVFDEIYIREDLVYDKYSSKVIGFVNLGDVDQQLSALEVDSSLSPPTIATRMLTLMIRGIFSEIHFPLANFPTAGTRACILHDIMWEATEHLERSDFIVCFQTGDGGSPHQRLVLGS